MNKFKVAKEAVVILVEKNVKELERLVTTKRRVAVKMMEEFAGVVKNSFPSAPPVQSQQQTVYESPMNSSRGGKYHVDQQTAQGEASLAGWGKPKEILKSKSSNPLRSMMLVTE